MKRLSFRFVRRAFLILALLFPVLYMFGSFVAGLAGSHGNVTFAQDEDVVTSSQVIDFNQKVNINFSEGFSIVDFYVSNAITKTQYSDHADYTLEAGSHFEQTFRALYNVIVGHTYYLHVVGNAPTTGRLYYGNSLIQGFDTSSYFNPISTANSLRFGPYSLSETTTYSLYYIELFDMTQMFGDSIPDVSVFNDYLGGVYHPYVDSNRIVYEVTDVPTYSEFVFNQILGNDNIIKQWGYYALADDAGGFAPFRDVVRFMDDTFFHFGTSNDLALFVYGYVYYALNIVAIYELIALVVMVFTIPLKLTDRFTKEM